MTRLVFTVLAVFLLAACQKGQEKAKPASGIWEGLPEMKEVKKPYPKFVLDLGDASNRYLFCKRPIGFPQYCAFKTRPGKGNKSVMPAVTGCSELHEYNNLLFADTNHFGYMENPCCLTGMFISKHGYLSRLSYPKIKKPNLEMHLTFWHNQKEIRRANTNRWNSIMRMNSQEYRERMAKNFRKTNTQTDEVWEDDVDLTFNLLIITNNYAYRFYRSGHSAKTPEAVIPIDPFQPLTAQFKITPAKDDEKSLDLQLFFTYANGRPYFMYKRDYDLESTYWRQAEHVTLQDDPKKVPVTLTIAREGQAKEIRNLTLQDFVANYFPYVTFTNSVTGVRMEKPDVPATIKATIDGGPLYGPIKAETQLLQQTRSWHDKTRSWHDKPNLGTKKPPLAKSPVGDFSCSQCCPGSLPLICKGLSFCSGPIS